MKILFSGLMLFMLSQACASTADYEDLLEHREGFAEKVTGGAAGQLIQLDSLDFASLRKAVSGDQPKWIRFKSGLTGKIELDGDLFIGSNTTIDGRGADITFTSPGDCDSIRFWKKTPDWQEVSERRNLIIHNIKIDRLGKGDNCGQGIDIAWGAKDVWIDHVSFSHIGDESFTIGKGATGVTVSWCKFVDTDKAILLGWNHDGDDVLDKDFAVTVHHNYFLRVNGRSPASTHGKVHYYNNYNVHWNWGAVYVGQNSRIVMENNIFGGGRWPNSAAAVDSEANKWYKKAGLVSSSGDRFLHTSKPDIKGGLVGRSKTFEPSRFYEYRLDEAGGKLLGKLYQHTGWSRNPAWPQ